MQAKQRRDTTRWVYLLELPRVHGRLERDKNENKNICGERNYLQPIQNREKSGARMNNSSTMAREITVV
jgi:hypothetical protein